MANYEEAQVAGVKWKRCHRIEIRNPVPPATPVVDFVEQEIMFTDAFTSIPLNESSLSIAFNPAAIIDVYNPVTLEKTGQTFTHADLYGMLFSAYMTVAKARDAANTLSVNPPA